MRELQHASVRQAAAVGGASIHSSAMVTARAIIDVAAAFDRDRVKYLVVGGLAVIAHGYTRLTKDVDLVIDFGEGNEHRGISALKGLGYQSRIPEPMDSFAKADLRQAWAREKGMLFFTVWKQQDGHTNEIDLFLNMPFNFDSVYRNALWKPADPEGRVLLPFVDYDNLIRMKTLAGRPRDMEDIRNLSSIRTVK